VYVGDDVTDEDAFHALPEGIGVLVSGEGPATFADYGLAGPEAVRAFLDAIAGTLEGPS
jgi:trehalose 6-phosphate phosphatase